MRNKTTENMIATVVLLALCAFSPAQAAAQGAADGADPQALAANVAALEQEAAVLEEENRGMRQMVQSLDDDEVYLVVDTESNRLFIRRGEHVLKTIVVSTGSRRLVRMKPAGNGSLRAPPVC